MKKVATFRPLSTFTTDSVTPFRDLDDWLRQADISIDTHQVQQGEENQSAVVKLVNYEARARAWALQPQRRQS